MFSKGLTQCTQVNYSIVDDVLRNPRVTRNFKKTFRAAHILHTIEMKVIIADKILRPPDQNFVNDHVSQNGRYAARDLHTIEMKDITADKILRPPDQNFVGAQFR